MSSNEFSLNYTCETAKLAIPWHHTFTLDRVGCLCGVTGLYGLWLEQVEGLIQSLAQEEEVEANGIRDGDRFHLLATP